MANAVLGFASSHGGMMTASLGEWSRWEEQDKQDPRFDYAGLLARARPNLDRELTPERKEDRRAAVQRGIAQSRSLLEEIDVDTYVVLSNPHGVTPINQMAPTFGVYLSDAVSNIPRTGNRPRNRADWREWESHEEAPGHSDDYPINPRLADHLTSSLIADGFDLSVIFQSAPSAGIDGHEFTNIYDMFLPDRTTPIVPILVSRYRPNQATPARCFAFGKAIRRAIESWEADARVAVVASGGLSHQVVDEDLDRQVIRALVTCDAEVLCSLPIDRLNAAPGTAETLNWIALAGAMDPLPMTLIDYIPCYRSRAGTGLAVAFGYWR